MPAESVITINGDTGVINVAESGLTASITSVSSDVDLHLEAVCTEPPREFFEIVQLSIDLALGEKIDSWEQIGPRSFFPACNEVVSDFLLPDNQATVYFGWHMPLRSNQIEIGSPSNGGFDIKWTCVAADGPQDDYRICVEAWLPFTGVKVMFPDLFEQALKSLKSDSAAAVERALAKFQPSVELARKRLGETFNAQDFGSPQALRCGYFFPFVHPEHP